MEVEKPSYYDKLEYSESTQVLSVPGHYAG